MNKKWNFAAATAIVVLAAWAMSAGGCATPQAAAPPTLDNTAPEAASGAGSFPRSFLIPGTSTSVRIGGSVSQSFYTH